MRKINLASGQRPFKPPWLNVDIRDQGYLVDVLTDAKDLNMFPNESVEIIVAHHLFEHIPIHEHGDYIREWRRVLKTGGMLSVFVPNMREMAKAWLGGRVSTFIYNVNSFGAFQGHVTDLHRWSYDKQELDDRICGWDGKDREFNWECRDYNPNNIIYEGADIAQDWYILSREYVKR